MIEEFIVFSEVSATGFRHGVPGDYETVVEGFDFTYDAETGVPTGGTVTSFGTDASYYYFGGQNRLTNFDPISVAELIEISPLWYSLFVDGLVNIQPDIAALKVFNTFATGFEILLTDQDDFFRGFQELGVLNELDYTIFGRDGDDDIDISYETGDKKIYGNQGNDRIQAGQGSHELRGGQGDDHISHIGGNSILYGGEGDDDLFSGYVSDDQGTNDTYGGAGNDYIISQTGGYTDAGTGNDTVYGGGGESEIHLGTGDDYVDVFDGNCTIYGGDGRDLMRSFEGIAEIRGNRGNDSMVAAGEYAELRGGKGLDYINAFTLLSDLWGGKDSDLFVFVTEDAAGTSTIHDFSVEEDLLRFGSLTVDGYTPETTQEAFDYFLSTAEQIGTDVSWHNGNGFSVLIKNVDLEDFTLSNFDGWDFYDLQTA